MQEIIIMVGSTSDGTKFLTKTRMTIKNGKKEFQAIGTCTSEQIDAAIAALEADKKLLENTCS